MASVKGEASVLQEAVEMSKIADVHGVLDDAVWGLFDQAIAYIKMNPIKRECSEIREDPSHRWFAISFHTQARSLEWPA